MRDGNEGIELNKMFEILMDGRIKMRIEWRGWLVENEDRRVF